MTVRVGAGLDGCLRELRARGVPTGDLVRGAVTDRLQRLLAARPEPSRADDDGEAG